VNFSSIPPIPVNPCHPPSPGTRLSQPQHEAQSPISTPCIGLCQFNNGGYCTGCCFRNTVEKVRWPTMAESEKAFVVATCAKCKANQHPSRVASRESS